ncbi:MAG TPA: 4-hydroxy-tetrahydrodipicolinate reductase [Afipia sp.]
MTVRVTLVGVTGWVGRELVKAIESAGDLSLVAAVSRSGAGKDAAEAAGLAANGVTIAGTLQEALATPSDVVIDYTKPDVVKGHTLAALAANRHVVIGTSGLAEGDFAEIDAQALRSSRGVLAAGNFSITATLMSRFALEAARYVPDVEIIDYAGPKKVDTPSGTARELAELLGPVRMPATSKPVEDLSGLRETRGGRVGDPNGVQIHSVRMPSFVLSCEVLLSAESERLSIRHDSGTSAAPYVAGTLLAAKRVSSFIGLKRGLSAVM